MINESNKSQKEKELDCIIKQIRELQNKRYELWKQCDNEFLEQAKSNVGRCFYDTKTNVYVKIIDVPHSEFDDTCSHVNRYQYPAIFIGKNSSYVDDIIPFYIDTLFSGAWGEGHSLINPYREISKEEFDKQFVKTIERFKECVISNGQSDKL